MTSFFAEPSAHYLWTTAEAALDQGGLARRIVSEGKSVREIALGFNVHPATIYRLWVK
ncbi:MAG: hypothetical protein JOY96_08900 [Verrucomicrobia bacterium]|nr:hypothetical protein [Verrucomicrobiota bacterium]MBV9674613.1 hypothetical protein [Verrucomicrobiota bacterium]